MNSLPPAMEIGPMRGYVNKKKKKKKMNSLFTGKKVLCEVKIYLTIIYMRAGLAYILLYRKYPPLVRPCFFSNHGCLGYDIFNRKY